MKNIPIAIACAALVLCSLSCAEREMLYSPAQINVSQVQRGNDGTITVTFQAMAETAYYCSAVRVEAQKDQILVKFVRRSVGESSGKEVKDFTVPNVSGLPVRAHDGTRVVEIWPDNKMPQAGKVDQELKLVPLRDLK